MQHHTTVNKEWGVFKIHCIDDGLHDSRKAKPNMGRIKQTLTAEPKLDDNDVALPDMDLILRHLAFAAVVFHSHLALSHPIWRTVGVPNQWSSVVFLWNSFFFHGTSIWIAFHPCLLGISCHLAVCWLIVILFLTSLPYSLHFFLVSSTIAGHRCFLSSQFLPELLPSWLPLISRPLHLLFT